ncbi:MAG TPA: DNA-formamidopyrimidine glycosylase family protein [Gaiellaceae bacterium]|jgi:endonuclease-8
MPEGDALHRAARRLQPLVGERVEVETPNPRAQVGRIAERLDGRLLLSVEAVGKNLLLTFEGGVVLRSHLRMNGRWSLVPRGSAFRGRPWLVLRGTAYEALQWNGPVLELHARGLRRLGPDVLAEEPDVTRMVANMRADDQGRAVGDALLDQRIVAGIGNKWRSEALWAVELSPWRPLAETTDEEVRAVLAAASGQMRGSLAGRRHANRVYRRAGRPCPRCGGRIVSRGQGDANRIAYWCPGCQR